MSDPIELRCRVEEGVVVCLEVIIGWTQAPEDGRHYNPPIRIPCHGGHIELGDVLALQRRGVTVTDTQATVRDEA